MSRRLLRVRSPLDLRLTLGILRHGPYDPTIRVGARAALRATRTPDGPATVRADLTTEGVALDAWGPGAGWALEHAPGLLGAHDSLDGFDPRHPVVRDLHRRGAGMRLPATHRVIEALVPAVLAQRVNGFESIRAYQQVLARWGEPAPGPVELTVPPDPSVLAGTAYYDLHVLGVERRRADTLRRACAHAARLEAAATSPVGLRQALEAIPGIGVWTSAEVSRVVLADADAVSVGDHQMKHLVAWALAREPRGTDSRMLELLEELTPHRGRVCRLIELSGISAPRYGHRQRAQPIASR